MNVLNLIAKNDAEKSIIAYLEQHANDILIAKINNGVPHEKDGISLINKKDIAGFMKFATEEAKKLAEKGANSACVLGTIVFGWAMHYFEEDSILGTLYNLDGTKYIPPKPKKQQSNKAVTPPTISTQKQNKTQLQASIFDLIAQEPVSEPNEPAPEILVEKAIISETVANTVESKNGKTPIYNIYSEIQEKYPNATVILRLGDFYEVFGQSAIIIAEKLELTLTSRKCGSPERVPMVGFPYYAAETYFQKINTFFDIVIVNTKNDVDFRPKTLLANEDGVVIEETNNDINYDFFETDALAELYEIFGDELMIL